MTSMTFLMVINNIQCRRLSLYYRAQNTYDLSGKQTLTSVYCASQSYSLRIDEKQLPNCFKVICSTNNIIRLPLLGAKEMDW